MMSKRMRDIQILAKCKPKVRKVLIEHGPNNLVLSICECCHNVLKETVSFTKRQKQHLSRYKKHLRDFADKKVSRVRKRRLLTQQLYGGGGGGGVIYSDPRKYSLKITLFNIKRCKVHVFENRGH